MTANKILSFNTIGLFAAFILIFFFAVNAFYPGGMSVDSFSLLQEARSFSFSDHHPPAFALLWHFIEFFYPGPSGMMIVLTGTFYISLAFIFYFNSPSLSLSDIILFCLVALFPPIFGIIGVIWIDISMAAFFLLAVCLAMAAYKSKSGIAQRILCILAILALFFGVAQRHNGLPAALGLIPFITLSTYKHAVAASWKKFTLFCLTILLLIFCGVSFVNRFFTSERMHLWQIVCLYDIAGISVRADENLLPKNVFPEITLDHLKTLYTPVSYTPLIVGKQIHSVETPHPEAPPLHFCKQPEELQAIRAAWLRAIVAHPIYYIKHRVRFFVELVHFNSRPVWMPVYNAIIPNTFDIPPIGNHGSYINYIETLSSNTPLFRPFIYLILVLILLPIILIVRPQNTLLLTSLLASGTLHMGGLFVGAVSGDFRYSHWMIICVVLCSAFCIKELIQKFYSR